MENRNIEITNVQNPAIGAMILWKFICGYKSNHGLPTPFPLLFIVLPVVFREDLREIIKSTQRKKGLFKVSQKLYGTKQNDELYSINNSAKEFRELTLNSFNVGVASKLFAMDFTSALVYSFGELDNKKAFSLSTTRLLSIAEKFGVFCSELTLVEISNLMKVRF